MSVLDPLTAVTATDPYRDPSANPDPHRFDPARTDRRQRSPMIAVIFEVRPHAATRQKYLDIAAELRPLLDGIDGFLSIERFQSLTDPEKLLSLSFWRDEDAVARWRGVEAHRDAQFKGRATIFQDYRLRIASVVRDYGLEARDEAPADSRAVHG